MPLTTISIYKETKEELDKLKLCKDESYNSLLERMLPEWMIILKNKLEEEKQEVSPQSQNETNSNS